MPQISKIPLDREIEVRIKELLDDGLATLGSRDDIEAFLSDLLTPTEKIMLGKRLAIAILLETGYNYREISLTLKVSTSTVATVVNWRKLNRGGYSKIIKNLLLQEKWKNVLDLISKFVAGKNT